MSETPRRPTPPPDQTDSTAPVMRALGSGDSTADRPGAADVPTLAPQAGTWETRSLIGQVFGDFELTEELGRGGMGVVYKAVQRSLERPVALKLLLSEYASNPLMLTRFLAEARAAASLTHPNIISIYQVGECIAGPYFVMEFIDGPSLELLLNRTLPVPWTAALMTTVAEAVQHAHDKGIIHRDLKPANVMLHRQKRPVVMDFGIAKIVGRSGSGNLTSPGSVIGTPAYMPPEQAGDDPGKIGAHSDVYSLGAILYTLLSGRAPFDEGTALRTILRVISPDPPPPVRDHRAEVPHRLEQIVMKCLQKDPAKRYPTAQALADDLKRFRAGQPAAGPSAIRVALPTLLLVPEVGKPLRLFAASTVIGRSVECDLVLKVSEVSKKHCRILLSHETAHVEDLGSVNGTFLNDEPLESGKRTPLSDGDKLDIAGQVFTVRIKPGSA